MVTLFTKTVSGSTIFIIVLFSLLCCHASAQNLVPNPGFDSIIACPNSLGQLLFAPPWKMLESPDLFNECAISPDLQVPKNFNCNYLPSHNGGGYIGLASYFAKEAVYVKLLEPLKAGKQYYARFYVATDDECPSSVHTSIDAIGMGIKGTGPNDNFKIVADNRGNILKDTANWTRVGGCFQAKGGELTLQIGNFWSDDETLLETSDPRCHPMNRFAIFILMMWCFYLLTPSQILC